MCEFKNPNPTVDVIIQRSDGFVMIKRKKDGLLAFPGGFVDEGESCEYAAIRECREEINLGVTLIEQFHTYSHPGRDPRAHNMTTVFIAKVKDMSTLEAGDDAADVHILPYQALVEIAEAGGIAFDHWKILNDYVAYMHGTPRYRIFDPMKDAVIKK